MSLKQDFMELEELFVLAMKRMREMRVRIESLEKQNQRLRERIDEEQVRGESEMVLKKLYDEGYHVCPAHYGEERHGEGCLFCLSFLEK